MGFNSEWNVFVAGDSNTFPIIDNKMVHIFTGKEHLFGLTTKDGFTDLDGNAFIFKTPIYWYFTPITPNKVSSRYCEKCSNPNFCEYCDDGYCLDNLEEKVCNFSIGVFEYSAYNE